MVREMTARIPEPVSRFPDWRIMLASNDPALARSKPSLAKVEVRLKALPYICMDDSRRVTMT
jgi:hypothetical protein